MQKWLNECHADTSCEIQELWKVSKATVHILEKQIFKADIENIWFHPYSSFGSLFDPFMTVCTLIWVHWWQPMVPQLNKRKSDDEKQKPGKLSN